MDRLQKNKENRATSNTIKDWRLSVGHSTSYEPLIYYKNFFGSKQFKGKKKKKKSSCFIVPCFRKNNIKINSRKYQQKIRDLKGETNDNNSKIGMFKVNNASPHIRSK